LREFVHRKETSETVGKIASTECLVSFLDTVDHSRRLLSTNDKATKFLLGMVAHFEDVRKAFPKAQDDGTMDFACELDDGNYVLVEMQVLPKDNWDKRALAYVAAFYGNQLRTGSKWIDNKAVIGINILGGGTREQVFWKDSHNQHVRHYKFQEQVHKQSCEMFIEGIELFQYYVMNAPDTFPPSQKAKQDWITFFKRGSRMTEAEVRSEIHTEAVLRAFERATLSKLPQRLSKIVMMQKNCFILKFLNILPRESLRAKKRAELRAEPRAKQKAELKRWLYGVGDCPCVKKTLNL
jgi:predicted transposase/invertase (TIGR01784 family)